jgi:ribose/xylose/arabinose/galactoside ABC-type transport system permease subunit
VKWIIFSPRWKQSFLSDYWVLLFSLVYFAILAPLAPGLASPDNIRNILSNAVPLAAVSLGQMIVLITGGIDLSATAIIGLASVVGAGIMSSESGWLAGSAWAFPCGLAAMLLVGIIVGCLNGYTISALRMPPFMVTLTTMMFFGGLAVWMTHSRPLRGLPAGFTALEKGRVFFIPAPLVLAAPLAWGIHLTLNRTMAGRWIYAVGMNARTSLLSGVPVRRVLFLAYAAAGLCAACGSILYTARLETGSPILGQRILLDVIGAAVIGGTSLFGGRGKVVWTLFGVLLICLIDNSLNMLGLSNFDVMMAKGAIILAAALLDGMRTRMLAGKS